MPTSTAASHDPGMTPSRLSHEDFRESRPEDPADAIGRPESAAPGSVNRPRHWLVGPWFDALFVANIAWPLIGLVAFSADGFDGRAGVQFWQVYFVTTPHRWITLLVVFLDRERFQEKRGVYLGLAATVVTGCVGLLLTTGSLLCLLAVEYAWNVWHFAAQHHGIYRLYSRGGGGGGDGARGATAESSFDKWLMRGFLLYVMGRVAGGTWSIPSLERTLLAADWLMLLPPLWLVAADRRNPGPGRGGGSLYLASVLLLYSSLLWAAHTSQPRLLLALATASALFHAVEYLAIVSWSVERRSLARGSRLGAMAHFAPRWGLFLAAYVLVLGAGGWLIEHHWFQAWLVLNLMAAFLHYAYDGLIWRRPASPRREASTSGPLPANGAPAFASALPLPSAHRP